MVFNIYSIHYIKMISRFHFGGKHVYSSGTTEEMGMRSGD